MTELLPCCGGTRPSFHTDDCHVVRVQTDRTARGGRYLSAKGDTRSRSVPCRRCHTPTFALSAVCDRCAIDLAVETYDHPEVVA